MTTPQPVPATGALATYAISSGPDQHPPTLGETMIPLDIRPNMELNPWTDLSASVAAGAVERIGLLPQGTAAGRPSVALLIRLPDGTPVIAQTTWALLSSAMRALNASPVAELDRRENP